MKITGLGFHDTYEQAAREIYLKPDFVSNPRGMEVKEKLGLHMEILNPSHNLFENKHRGVPLKYLANELVLYFAGKYNVSSLGDEASFGEASSFWKKIAKEDGTVNSAYGYLLFKHQAYEQQTQWDWIKNNLIADKDSRQAIAHINRPFHQYDGNKDFVCTMSYHFFIRENKLHMHVHRRSQDMVFGITYDVPWELLLMQCMVKELKSHYPELSLGSYNLFIGSAHIYQRDYDTIYKMLMNEFTPYRISIGSVNPIMHKEVNKMASDRNYKYKGGKNLFSFLSDNR